MSPLKFAVLAFSITIAAPAQRYGDTQKRAHSAKQDQQTPRTEAKKDKDAQLAKELLDALEGTLRDTKDSYTQAENINKILRVIDEGGVTTTDEQKVRVNEHLRTQLVRKMRELRATSESVKRRVQTSVIPRQRGLKSKLQARHDLETRAMHKKKLAEMVSDQTLEITKTIENLKVLDARLEDLSKTISIIEDQLDFLELSKEAIKMGSKLNDSLEKLNLEMGKIVEEVVRQQVKS